MKTNILLSGQSGITVGKEDAFWLLALYSLQLQNYPSEQDWQNAAWDLAVKKGAAECKPQLESLLSAAMGNYRISDVDRLLASAMVAFCKKVENDVMAHGPLLAHARVLGPLV